MDSSAIREYRVKQRMSLKTLAWRLRTSKANLSRIENGKQQISEEMLPRLQAETGIPASQLRPDLAKIFQEVG